MDLFAVHFHNIVEKDVEEESIKSNPFNFTALVSCRNLCALMSSSARQRLGSCSYFS